MQDFIDACFRWPTLPATLLLIVAVAYWLFVILGALDLDILDFDLDLDVAADAPSLGDLGVIGLRALNLGDVPVMVWGSVLALSWWTASVSIDASRSYAGAGEVALAIARNIGIALVATKLLTQPLKGKFDTREAVSAEELIGRTCIITTLEATTAFGRADVQTEGAPLNLNVRTKHGPLSKGDLAEIVDYDPDARVYFVSGAGDENRRDG